MPQSSTIFFSPLLAVALAAVPPSATAQTMGADGVLVFETAWFDAARPADAYDMVRRLPGFTLSERDQDVRGFAGARGNVLFDGQPPAGKQESLAALLRRIPASGIERIELIRGGTGGVDMAGYEMIANIVRRRAASTTGAAEAGLLTGEDGVARPSIRAELVREAGARRLEAALALETGIDDDSGSGFLVEQDPAGETLSRVRQREWEVQQNLSGSLSYQTPLLRGDASINASLGRETTGEDIDSGSDLSREDERVWLGEIGGRFGHAVGNGGQIELLGLHRRNHLRREAREEDERFTEATDLTESVARAEFRRDDPRLAINASVEGAINLLGSETALIEGGQPVALPGAETDVIERRIELAAGATWQPRAGMVIEPALRAEYSSLRVDGDARERLALFYLKPRLSISLPLGGGQLRMVAERSVGQLDFSDFVASTSLDRGDVSVGAPLLRPDSTWSAGLTFERRFWDDGAITLSYRHEWIDDVVDRIAIEAGGELFDAVGNIGSGSRHVGRGEIALPFARFGMPGLQVRAAITLQHSRVTDPVTGQRRSISGDRPVEGEISVVHDLPGGRWSWGADIVLATREDQFRFDEVRVETMGTSVDIHVEYRVSPRWRLRMEAANLTGAALREVRTNYDGPRSTAAVDGLERLELRTTRLVSLSIRHSFGRAR